MDTKSDFKKQSPATSGPNDSPLVVEFQQRLKAATDHELLAQERQLRQSLNNMELDPYLLIKLELISKELERRHVR